VLADVSQLANLPKPLSFEMLRWTCAVRDRRAGMKEETLRHKLGLSEVTWHETWPKIESWLRLRCRSENRRPVRWRRKT
jgi:integrase/recombinase XerD